MRYIIAVALASLVAFPADAEAPRVVTDIPPVASLVAQVMGDIGMPEVLLDKGADAHAFQMRPSQASSLAQADLIVWIGPEMTPWLDRAVAGLNRDGSDLRLLAAPDTVLRTYVDPDEHTDGHTDHATTTDDHDHAGPDPHAWLNPANASVWLAAISRDLSRIDPANAETYAANAAKAQTEMAAMDATLSAVLVAVQDYPLVVFHDAYGYFSDHYGLKIVGTISPGDAASPGAAHLRELQATMATSPVCIFPEANHDPRLLATLTEGTGARVGAALDPEGANLPNGPALYGDLMRALASAITECAMR